MVLCLGQPIMVGNFAGLVDTFVAEIINRRKITLSVKKENFFTLLYRLVAQM